MWSRFDLAKVLVLNHGLNRESADVVHTAERIASWGLSSAFSIHVLSWEAIVLSKRVVRFSFEAQKSSLSDVNVVGSFSVSRIRACSFWLLKMGRISWFISAEELLHDNWSPLGPKFQISLLVKVSGEVLFFLSLRYHVDSLNPWGNVLVFWFILENIIIYQFLSQAIDLLIYPVMLGGLILNLKNLLRNAAHNIVVTYLIYIKFGLHFIKLLHLLRITVLGFKYFFSLFQDFVEDVFVRMICVSWLLLLIARSYHLFS